MGEAVAARPIRAVRAGVAFGVVDTFLVRTADDAVGHDHGTSLMLAKEGLDLLADNRIAADIDAFGEPAFELIGRVAFVGDNGDGNLGGQVRSRAIEGDRRDWVALESAPSTFRQPGSRPFSDLLHVLMKYLELRVSVKGHARFTVFYGQSLDIETSETLLALAEFTPMRSEVPTSCTVGFWVKWPGRMPAPGDFTQNPVLRASVGEVVSE
jgi:hypothetical protein